MQRIVCGDNKLKFEKLFSLVEFIEQAY